MESWIDFREVSSNADILKNAFSQKDDTIATKNQIMAAFVETKGQILAHLPPIFQADKKHVIVAGLSGDYLRQPFGEILELVPLADDVAYKRALCKRCAHPGRPASFTKRLTNETATVSVASTYMAVCRMCYLLNPKTRQ